MDRIHRVLIEKLREHSALGREDVDAIERLSYSERQLEANEDLVRQGDEPNVSALVSLGVLARYHLLSDGTRQYLSFHLTGDLPDSQSLFLMKMDHAVCAIGAASVACFPHKELKQIFENRPRVGFAIWRETLVDAAIFREAITNSSSREAATRMAHLFSELFYRAEASKLTHNHAIEIPITLIQLGEALGMSIATVNRALSIIRETGFVDFQGGALHVHDWTQLARFAEFDPAYLHLRKAPLT